jgi:hypothetical protein
MWTRFAACCALVLLAACGSSSKPAATGGTTTSTTSTAGGSATSTTAGGAVSSEEACKLITRSEASTLFGTPASPKADSAPSNLAKSVCLWSAKPEELLAYLLQIRVYEGSKFYSGGVPGYEPLDGVADKAAIYELPGGSTIMISYEKGDTVVSISYSVQQIATGTRKTASDQKDELLALVKQAAGR